MSLEDRARYTAALHAVQSGIKALIGKGSDIASPKHLRVGVDSAMVGQAAIARLLLDKGVITMDEYDAALAAEMEREQMRLTDEVRKSYGSDQITLG